MHIQTQTIHTHSSTHRCRPITSLIYPSRARMTTNVFHVKAFSCSPFPSNESADAFVGQVHPPNKLQDSFALQIPFLVSGNVLEQTNSCKVRACVRDRPLCAGSGCFFICLFFMSKKFQCASINK